MIVFLSCSHIEVIKERAIVDFAFGVRTLDYCFWSIQLICYSHLCLYVIQISGFTSSKPQVVPVLHRAGN
jgi:hypothetical protein